jgi:stress response protein YsnF
MTEETIFAVYDTVALADAAVRDLEAAGVPSSAISRHTRTSMTNDASATGAPVQEKGFWSRLFGTAPDNDTSVYDRSLDSGSIVVTVRVTPEAGDVVCAILEQHDPVDLDERAASHATGTNVTPPMPTASPTSAATTDGGTVQLAQETLSVGKRAVSGGTTRIRRYVVETPVEEQVTLQSERVTLDRRPVTDGRPASAAEFTDKMVEMTETSEEAAGAKTSRSKTS